MRTPSATPYLLRPTLAVALLTLSFLALYLLTLQTVLYGDGVHYLTLIRDVLEGTRNPVAHHPLYPPLLVLVARAGHALGLDPIRSGALLSALTGAAGVGLAYALLLAWTSRPLLSLFATLALGLAPTTWFYSTTTENHTLHFLCATLLILGLTHAARSRSLAWLLFPGVLYVPTILSHTTALMLAPFLALTYLVLRAEAKEPPPWRSRRSTPARMESLLRTTLATLLLFGPMLLTRLFMASIYTWINQGEDPFHGHDPTATTLWVDIFPKAGLSPGLEAWLWENPLRLAHYTYRHATEMTLHVVEDWIYHSGLAALLFLAGLLLLLGRCLREFSPWPLVGLLALLPYAWLFSFWGFRPTEQGGYYLHILAPTMAVGILGLGLLPRPSHRILRLLLIPALLLLAGQGFLAQRLMLTHARTDTRQEWTRRAAELVSPKGAPAGIVLTGDDYRCVYARYFHPREVNALRLEDLEPFGPEELLEQIRAYRSWHTRIFADVQFFERAAQARPDLSEALETLPWRPVEQGILQGRILGAN